MVLLLLHWSLKDSYLFPPLSLEFNSMNVFGTFVFRGASLCSCGLHPDAIHHREQCLKAEKKAYYSNLQKYHSEYVKCYPLFLNLWCRFKCYFLLNSLVATSLFFFWQYGRIFSEVERKMGKLQGSGKGNCAKIMEVIFTTCSDLFIAVNVP